MFKSEEINTLTAGQKTDMDPTPNVINFAGASTQASIAYTPPEPEDES